MIYPRNVIKSNQDLKISSILSKYSKITRSDIKYRFCPKNYDFKKFQQINKNCVLLDGIV